MGKTSRSIATALFLLFAAAALLGQQPQKRTATACRDQARTLAELKNSFANGRMPIPSAVSGSWVAIGFFGAAHSHGAELARVECAGLMRDEKTFELAMFINGDSVVPRFVGASEVITRSLTFDGRGSLSFLVSFGGDASPTYRCRLTGTGTLACLVDVYDQGIEFTRMAVTEDNLCRPSANAGDCGAR